jgi:hypothetical protein
VIFFLTEDLISNPKFSELLLLSKSKDCVVIIVHPDGVQFPSISAINALPLTVKRTFDSIAIPYLDDYGDKTWRTICDKLLNKLPVTICGNNEFLPRKAID